MSNPIIQHFFDEPTSTFGYVVRDPESHVHADHLSAAPYLQEELGGKMGIGAHIRDVQEIFGKVFNAGTEFQCDGSQFDQLFHEGAPWPLAALKGGYCIHQGIAPCRRQWAGLPESTG